jgi:putative membrane protein
MTEIVSTGTSDKRTLTVRTSALWLLIACYLLAVICFTWNPTPIAQLLAAMGIVGACLHASMTYGFRHMLALFSICVVTTFAIENLGVATGFPFGHYHFEVGADLPHIGAIPVIVGPLWFGMGYFSWRVASILLDGADRRLDRNFNLIALPIVAAFVATQWDMVMEPGAATIGRAWIWHDGGAIFGVPLSNYFGWLLTAWLFFQMFALYLLRRRGPWMQDNQISLSAIAILFYVCSGLTQIVPWMMGQAGDVTDAAGHVWKIAELREATVAILMFTMFFTALLAALRLVRSVR